MTGRRVRRSGAVLATVCLNVAIVHAAADDPDRLYRDRADLPSARRAADLWATRAATEFDAAWKLSRVCYWLGTRAPEAERRTALERGIAAGDGAVRLAAGRPEGHFWLAANMGTLADTFGVVQGLRYRGRIRNELEQVIRIDSTWQNGSADAALGQWYFEVPRLLGGSRAKAEAHLRRALAIDATSLVALSVLADVVAADGRRDEARALLRRVVDAPVDPDWAPEDAEYKAKAAQRLRDLGR
ncbi:MAG TPA: TRAP transporter TatT component family protein [Vicinamibacterales bacterium]|nr:TRAP transporter TatT component family protein [Vicinamibacterales bacterium]